MNSQQGGFLKAIIIIVIALVILGYVFHISITDVLNDPKVQQSLQWLWGIILTIWSYIQAPIMYVWNNFVIGVVWNAIKAGLGQ
jgi:hypothetical protein